MTLLQRLSPPTLIIMFRLRSPITLHRRTLRTTPSVFNATAARPNPRTDADHTPDSYSKDVDVSPPPDPTIHRVDAASEAVQKPHEPPSGEYSRAGTKTKDYEHGSPKKA